MVDGYGKDVYRWVGRLESCLINSEKKSQNSER